MAVLAAGPVLVLSVVLPAEAAVAVAAAVEMLFGMSVVESAFFVSVTSVAAPAF